jgi:hypothetical protein
MKRLLLAAIAVLTFATVTVPAPSEAATAPSILKWSSAIPGWNDAYYWYDTDGARYAFTPSASFQSWFPGEPTGVATATIEELAPIALKGAVPHRPGVRLIQFESSPNVYVVDRFGMLRWVTTEQVALELYDENWKSLVDTLSVADYPLYRFGSPITDAAEFDPHAWDALTSPATNVVNALKHPPETMRGGVNFQTSAEAGADMLVGEPVTFVAEIEGQETTREHLTIRLYDTQDQVIATCAMAALCRATITVGGPVGEQRFVARVFNEYGQAIVSELIVRSVKNP